MMHNYIVPIIVAIFASGGFWAVIQSCIQTRSRERSAEQKLILGIAFKEIIETCQKHLDNGEIDPDEYKELNHYLFEPYEALGGDGTAARLVKEVEKLPIKKER